MATGGWKYVGYNTNPHSGSPADHLTAITNWQTYLVTNLASEGWSLHAAPVNWSNQLFWFAIEHTGGARVVFVYGGDLSGTVIEASNEQYNVTRDNGAHENTWWVAYIQPHLSATALGTNPATAGFLPSGSLKFTSMWGYGELSGAWWGEPFGYHVAARGGNIWFAVAADIDGNTLDPTVAGPHINTLCLMGEFLDRLAHENHSTEPDNHADSKYGMLSMDDCNYSTTYRLQFFDAAQNHRTTGSIAYLSSLLTDDVCDREPWVWQVPTFYVSSNDLDNAGVVTGNGIKGSMNPEWFRFTMFPGGPANDKQRLDGGDFVYLRNGIAVGYDPSNGSMV
jgi:hypothetical protein